MHTLSSLYPRRAALLMLLCLCALMGMGQNLTVASMGLTNEVLQAKDQRLDLNGKKCALVRVLLPVSGVVFEGSVMGDVEYSVNEYKVHLVPGTKMLYVKCPGYKPLMVTFPDHGVDRVEAGLVYRLDIDQPQTATPKKPNARTDNFVMLSINPPLSNVNVKIDGTSCVVDGGIVAKLLEAGHHAYTIEAPGYETASGTFAINGDAKTQLTVDLVSLLATLKVKAATSGCEIWINGVKEGTNIYL